MLLAASFLVLVLLARMSGARPDWGRLRRIHAEQGGAVETLGFVLALPLFVMVLLFIVQVSQLMIGQMVVEYAAFAAARAAAVWVPARIDDIESWNCVYAYAVDDDAVNQDPSQYGPTDGGVTYKLTAVGQKYERMRMAAALACLPVSPSRPWSATDVPSPPTGILEGLEKAYAAVTDGSAVDNRLRNKLAYTLFQDPSDPSRDTLTVDVRFYHSNQELPLWDWEIPSGLVEFRPLQEAGWQDPITVTVKYNLALLPGPGRLLARSGVPGITGQQGNPNNVYTDLYTYPLSATATVGNEGEKPMYAYFRFP